MLLISWSFGLSKPSVTTLVNVTVIVLGVIIASVGEFRFVFIGFLYQCGGIFFESFRLVMVQKLLNSEESKMDPLVSLYYLAPVCTVMNCFVALIWEVPRLELGDITAVGLFIFFLNAMLAFLLNVSVVFLVSLHPGPSVPKSRPQRHERYQANPSHSIDWPNLLLSSNPLRRSKGHPPRRHLHAHLGDQSLPTPIRRLQHCPRWPNSLQTGARESQSAFHRRPAMVDRVWQPTAFAEEIARWLSGLGAASTLVGRYTWRFAVRSK